jgi:hypothetical protein
MYIEVKGWWRNTDIIKTNFILSEYSNIDLRIIDDIKILKQFINNKLTIHDLIHVKDLIIFTK